MTHLFSKSLGLRALVLGLGAMVTLGVPAVAARNYAAPASSAKAKVLTVQIKDFAFVPALINIKPGTTVTWINADEDPHTVTASNKGFHSAALDTNGKFSMTFKTAGSFAYFCSLHPHMVGKVVVKA